MGTIADFYIGVGEKAEWIGSTAWDGYQWHEEKPNPIADAKTEEAFRAAVKKLSEDRDDFTKPENGWPWPWVDSNTTDYAYCFVDGKMEAYNWGAPAGGKEDAPSRDDWPNMKAIQNVQFGAKSGVMIVSLRD